MHFSKIITLSILMLLSPAANKANFRDFVHTASQFASDTGKNACTNAANAAEVDAKVFIKEIAKNVFVERIPTIKIKGAEALNANEIIEVSVDVAATLHEELKNENKDGKSVGIKALKKGARTLLREKILAGAIAAGNKAGVTLPLPEVIEQNAKAKYVTKLFLANFARNIIDTMLGKFSNSNTEKEN